MSAFLLLLYPLCKHGRSWRNRCPYFLPSRFYFITIFLSVSVGLVPACLAVLFILTVHLRSAADKKRLLSIMRYIYIYTHVRLFIPTLYLGFLFILHLNYFSFVFVSFSECWCQCDVIGENSLLVLTSWNPASLSCGNHSHRELDGIRYPWSTLTGTDWILLLLILLLSLLLSCWSQKRETSNLRVLVPNDSLSTSHLLLSFLEWKPIREGYKNWYLFFLLWKKTL